MSNHSPNFVFFLALAVVASAKQSGRGSTAEYWLPGSTSVSVSAQAQAPAPFTILSGSGVSSLISRVTFNQLLLHRNDSACPARNFYTYDAFITAANSFSEFASTGDTNTRKKEIAAFLAQTSHETTGGWASAPDGPYSWGYCYIKEQGNPPEYCIPSTEWPCATGKKYYGRGPIQISYNYNYGLAGEAIGVDLLNYPDVVETDATISFKTALWFWMTPQSPNPSSHEVISGKWIPSAADISAGRLPGYGEITNIISGGVECVNGTDARDQDRIGFYKRYCQIMGVDGGDNLDCANKLSSDKFTMLILTCTQF